MSGSLPHLMPRLVRRLVLGALAIVLEPVQVVAGAAGATLAFVGMIGTPLWAIGTVLWLLGGSTHGDPLPPGAMILLLAGAIPAGAVLLTFANTPTQSLLGVGDPGSRAHDDRSAGPAAPSTPGAMLVLSHEADPVG